MMELLFVGSRVSVGEDEKVLEMDSGDWLHSSVYVVDANQLYS